MFKATFILENGNLFWTRKRKQNVQGVKPRTSTSTLLHLNAFRRSFDFLGVNICVRVGRVVGWMRTTPYGDNEKEASLGGTASVCPRVVCVWVCAYMCLRVSACVCVCVCVCVCQQESPRALWHLLIKTSQAAGQGRQMPIMTHTYIRTHTHTNARGGGPHSTACTLANMRMWCVGQLFLDQSHPTHSGITQVTNLYVTRKRRTQRPHKSR